jgi:uncharacterized protein YgbK (DUF1537 family)
LSLNLVRAGGPWAVSRFLDALAPGTYCIVNAITDADLDCVAQGAALCEKGSGRKILYQAAASFVRARGGILRRPLLSPDAALGHTGERGGLTVVGSHVAATTAQLESLLAAEPNVGIELDVADLLEGAAAVLPRLQQIESSLAEGRDVVIYTSRSERRGGSPQESLHMARTISESLCALVAALPLPPRYLIAKGGITSHDLATKALRVQRAVVLGQILPGVPVWRLGNEALFPQLPYVVFPGNVGGPNSLLDLFRLFKATRS